MKRYRLPRELDAFADFTDLPRRLRELAILATPESWQFRTLRNMPCGADEILARHLQTVYHRHAENYARARDQAEEDENIYFDRRFACFHSGLRTAEDKAIYLVFVKKNPGESGNPWLFNQCILEDDWWLESLRTRPLYPTHTLASKAKGYDPDWQVQVEYRQMLMDEDIQEYLPISLRSPGAFQRSIKAAVSHARQQAHANPEYAAPLVWQSRVEYALPLYLNGWDIPDVAMLLRPERTGGYTGHRLLLPEMAYMSARLLGRVKAEWMKNLLVEPITSGSGTARRQRMRAGI